MFARLDDNVVAIANYWRSSVNADPPIAVHVFTIDIDEPARLAVERRNVAYYSMLRDEPLPSASPIRIRTSYPGTHSRLPPSQALTPTTKYPSKDKVVDSL